MQRVQEVTRPAPAMVLTLALVVTPALADDLTVEQLAEIQHQQEKAGKAFDEAPGAKNAKEMSREERAELARKRAAADQAVLEKFGVDAKTVERAKSHLGRDDRTALKAKVEALEAKEKAAKSAGAPDAERAPEDVEVQVGAGPGERTARPAKPSPAAKKPGRRR